MRIVVVGATGNLGTSVLRALEKEESVESVLGLARRLPGLTVPKVEWAVADVVDDDLVPHFRGADAVVLLAWVIQPSRDLTKQWMVNVEGSTRVARAAKEAGVPSLLYASSAGARVQEGGRGGDQASLRRTFLPERARRPGPDQRRPEHRRPALAGGPLLRRGRGLPARHRERGRRWCLQPRDGARPGRGRDRTHPERPYRAGLLATGPRRRRYFVEAQAATRAAGMAGSRAAGPDHGHDKSQNGAGLDTAILCRRDAARGHKWLEDRERARHAAALPEDRGAFSDTRDTHRSRGEGALKAVVWHGKEDVRVDDVPDPIIQESTDAIVRITSTAICGSDLHLYAKLSPLMREGDIIGHEPMGIVEEVGADVEHIVPGDRVVVPFNVSCGHCFFCDQDLFSQCETTRDTGKLAETVNLLGRGRGASLFC